jgi:hypothetical protein
MNIEGGAGRRWSVEAAGGKLKYLVDLFARDVKLLDDFVDRGAGFEVFEYSGNGHARVAKYPSAAQAAGYCDQSSVGTRYGPGKLFTLATSPAERGKLRAHLINTLSRKPSVSRSIYTRVIAGTA